MEYRRKCNVCGKIYCYTDKDLKDNTTNSGLAALESLGSLASILGGGTIFHTQYLTNQANRYSDKVVDYSKCPSCGSTSTSFLTEDEWNALREGEKKEPAQVLPPQQPSRITVNSGATPESLVKRALIFLEDGEWEKADGYCEACLDLDPENAQAYLGKLMAELHVRRQEDLPNCEQPFDGSGNFQKAVRFGGDTVGAVLNGYIAHINERNENARLTDIYDGAVAAMNAANTESAYKAAAERLKTIPGFKDADSLVGECLEKAELYRKTAIYSEAKAEQEKDTAEGYEAAIDSFRTISGWRDVDEQIIACQRKIEEIKAKEEADRLEAEQKRIAAEKAAKKRKKIAAIVTPIVVACIAFIIVLTTVIIPNGKYNDAISLIEKGDIINAYEGLIALNGYKDSADKAEEIHGQYEIEKLEAAAVGDVVRFGSYEQDNDASNGEEAIEWLVLAKEGNKALVISKYALDCQRYNTSNTSVTWETCSLRKWLNGTFIDAAFSSDEQNSIIHSMVTADKNPSYNTSPGNSTTDKVFLLSITEANKYFSSDSARQCSATAYAKAQGAYTNTSNGNCFWGLRSPGYNSGYAADVISDGSVSIRGYDVDYGLFAVRPAMWIDLGA